jgi:hypothetical protein
VKNESNLVFQVFLNRLRNHKIKLIRTEDAQESFSFIEYVPKNEEFADGPSTKGTTKAFLEKGECNPQSQPTVVFLDLENLGNHSVLILVLRCPDVEVFVFAGKL